MGKSNKRPSGSSLDKEGSGGAKKKRKKGRPPKNSGSGDKLSSKQLKGGSSPREVPAVRANASWT